VRVFLSKYRGYTLCPDCSGSRLRLEARLVRVSGKTLPEVCRDEAAQAAVFFDNLTLSASQMGIAARLLEEIRNRLKFLIDVGLQYLTLDRLASTLSGGEAQRIQLATNLGASLVGALYVLDEPSIGLHPRDNVKLIPNPQKPARHRKHGVGRRARAGDDAVVRTRLSTSGRAPANLAAKWSFREQRRS